MRIIYYHEKVNIIYQSPFSMLFFCALAIALNLYLSLVLWFSINRKFNAFFEGSIFFVRKCGRVFWWVGVACFGFFINIYWLVRGESFLMKFLKLDYWFIRKEVEAWGVSGRGLLCREVDSLIMEVFLVANFCKSTEEVHCVQFSACFQFM